MKSMVPYGLARISQWLLTVALLWQFGLPPEAVYFLSQEVAVLFFCHEQISPINQVLCLTVIMKRALATGPFLRCRTI